MSLLPRGLSILDETPDDPVGGPAEPIEEGKTPDEVITTPSDEKPEATPEPDKVPAEPAPPSAETEDDPDDDVTEADITTASRKVAKQNRRIKREHAGLMGEVESMQKDAEEAPILRARVKELEKVNDHLYLAAKYGVTLEFLDGLAGDKEAKEKFIITQTHPADSDPPPAEKPTKKIEEPEPKKEDAPVGDPPVEEKPKPSPIPDVDADRPPAKTAEEKSPTEGMTHEQELAYLREQI